MRIDEVLEKATAHRHGILITVRRDGRPQSSDVVFAILDGMIKISVTHDRAKTRNIIRDPRAVFHITDPGAWSYVSIDSTAEVSTVAAQPDDATVDELVEIYRVVAGEHDNWADFRQAMVDEGRCVIRLTPNSVTGQFR